MLDTFLGAGGIFLVEVGKALTQGGRQPANG